MRLDRIIFATELARADITVQELAKRSSVSRATITAVKSGKTCSPETARKIASGLCVPVENLIAKEGI